MYDYTARRVDEDTVRAHTEILLDAQLYVSDHLTEGHSTYDIKAGVRWMVVDYTRNGYVTMQKQVYAYGTWDDVEGDVKKYRRGQMRYARRITGNYGAFA